mmetsp:Transcript_48089/g.150898  ORF Transcript_48089/g.150898 Transcript_48089/m.150898 type:complete len:317 (+) Transcript_48089:415-1365(+)
MQPAQAYLSFLELSAQVRLSFRWKSKQPEDGVWELLHYAEPQVEGMRAELLQVIEVGEDELLRAVGEAQVGGVGCREVTEDLLGLALLVVVDHVHVGQPGDFLGETGSVLLGRKHHPVREDVVETLHREGIGETQIIHSDRSWFQCSDLIPCTIREAAEVNEDVGLFVVHHLSHDKGRKTLAPVPLVHAVGYVGHHMRVVVGFEHESEYFELVFVHHLENALNQLPHRLHVEISRHDRNPELLRYCSEVRSPRHELVPHPLHVPYRLSRPCPCDRAHLFIGEGICEAEDGPEPARRSSVNHLPHLLEQPLVLPPVA